MKTSSFGKLAVFIILFWIIVVGATAWLHDIPLTWSLFILPVLASLTNVFLFGLFLQHNAPAHEATPTPSAQSEEIEQLHKKLTTQQYAHKALQQELAEAKENANQAANARTTFLNNIGHELRTPLSIVLGYTALIVQKAEQDGDEELLTLAQKTKLYAKDFSAIVNDVLQISELESGQVGFLLEAFNITNVIDQAINQVQTYLDVNENDLLLVISPDIGSMIADRDKVRIILENLLSNAAKFTKKGTVTLTAQRDIGATQPWIIFHITDTGIGITQEQYKQIFKPFLQGDNTLTKAHEGAGLGLAITQRYCELMGGRIEFESTVGEGATFSVYLPAEVTAVPAMYVRKQTKPTL